MKQQEKLSALVDGELDEAESRAISGKSFHPETLAKIELYYRIGEELRADSAKASLSQEFSKRMAAALAAEPPHAGPAVETLKTERIRTELSGRSELEDAPSDGAPRQPIRHSGLIA